MDTEEEYRRKPWVRGGAQGRLLEEVVQNYFEVQDGLCETGPGKLFHEASAAIPLWAAVPDLRGSCAPRSRDRVWMGWGT